MADEPTELDKKRAAYVEQIIAHVCNRENNSEDVVFLVDNLLMEWGADAYRQGRQHMATRIKRCADDWVNATN